MSAAKESGGDTDTMEEAACLAGLEELGVDVDAALFKVSARRYELQVSLDCTAAISIYSDLMPCTIRPPSVLGF